MDAVTSDEAAREIVSRRVIGAPREAVFHCLRDPERLARWWGPAGFRNTFETFEFRPGGTWKFVMHGPDGRDHPNLSVFREIEAPARIVLEHLGSIHHFFLTITLEVRGGATEVGWRMLFDSVAERDETARYAVGCNEENFDRLQAELARGGTTMNRQIFVNLPTRDMERSQAFFAALGFSFNPRFTNDQGACMVIADNIFAMLLVEPFFQTFTRKPVADAGKSTEVLLCLSCASRAEVDDLVRKALAAGGTAPMPVQDHGFMYGHGFTDLDGHMWELVYMDPGAVPPPA